MTRGARGRANISGVRGREVVDGPRSRDVLEGGRSRQVLTGPRSRNTGGLPPVFRDESLALWLDSKYSVSGEPRVINRGTGDRTGVSGAVIYNGAAVLPGVTGNAMSTPSASALNVAGDIELVARITTSAFGQNEPTIHGNFAAGGGYGVTLRSNGNIQFDCVVGAVTISQQSAAVVTGLTPFTGWLKVTRNATTGDISYYKASDQATEPSSWTLINTANRASGSLDAAVTNFGVGYRLSANNFFFHGSIYRAIVRDGIDGTTVLDVDLANVANWSSSFTATTGQTVTLNTTAADYGAPSALDAKYGSVLGAYVYDGAAVLPGLAGNYLSTPDAAALDITGDIEMVARVTFTNFTGDQGIICKYTDAGNQRSYYLQTNTDKVRLYWSTTGADFPNLITTSALPFSAGETGWLKVAFDVDNGAGGKTMTVYTAPDQATEPSSWTLLQAVTQATATSIYAGTSPVYLGAGQAGSTHFRTGSIHRAIVRDGIGGTTVYDVDLADVADYATSFTATTGQTVTVNSTSSDTNDPLLLTHTGENYGFTPAVGANGLTVSTPGYTITGDVDIRMEISLDDWAHSGVAADVFGQDNGDGARWARIRLNSGGSVEFSWFPLGTWASRVAQSSSEALSSVFSPGDRGWLRITLDTDNGSGGYDVTFYTSTDGVTWDQLGAVRTGGATTSLFSTGTSVRFTANSTWGGGNLATRWYRCLVKDGIDGTTVLDVNAATDITDAGATSFTATSGQTVTVNRATSGRKTALVTRPVWLFGTDDYLEIAASELFQIPADQDLTMVCVSRHWATMPSSGVMIAQLDASNQEGFRLYYNNNVTATTAIEEPSGAGASASIATTNGPLYTYTGVIDRTAQEMTTYLNTTPGTPTDISSIGTLEDDTAIEPLHVGSNSGTTNFADAEIVAVAVWRRVLTADEITAICQYYGTV